jgi:hypothetical protein
MTGCKTGQPNESGKGDAVTIDNLGTKRLFRHPEWRFAPSIQHRLSCHGAFPRLNSPEGGGMLGVRSPALLPGRSYGKCRPNNVETVVWLSLEERTKFYPGYKWGGTSVLHGTTPMSIDRKLIAAIIDINTATLSHQQIWDCNYAIAPHRSRFNNEGSIKSATESMEIWLSKLSNTGN